MKKEVILFFLPVLLVSSCNINNIQDNKSVIQQSQIKKDLTILGKVSYPSFKAKSSEVDVWVNATVSLIYPSDYSEQSLRNKTVATGLTDKFGRFRINPDESFIPNTKSVFILEASNRIGGSGNDLITLRTLIKWNGEKWVGILNGVDNTYRTVVINKHTTAVTIIASLSDKPIDYDIVFGEKEYEGYTKSIYSFLYRVESLIYYLLLQGKDPVSEIVFSDGIFQRKEDIYYGCSKTTKGCIPEKDRIIYSGGGTLNSINSDGSDNKILFFDGDFNSWSPDKTKISSILFVNYEFNLYIMDSDGSNKHKITNLNLGGFKNYSWSSDSKKIFFYGSDANFNENGGIYSIDIDGTNPKQIIKNKDIFAFNLSPDGKKILFTNLYNIFIMNIDGSNIKQLTSFNNEFILRSFKLSSNGENIICQIDNNIYSLKVDGSNLTLLDNGESPIWSIDDKKIFYVKNNVNKQKEIYSMDLDGSNKRNFNQEGYEPKLSRDGKRIAFVSKRNLRDELFTMNIDGTDIKRIPIEYLSPSDHVNEPIFDW